MTDTNTSAPAPAFLETYIREQRKKKDILLMTHIVMGYPSFDASFEVVRQMVESGVDLMELQIPFSEPIADGPVILKANQAALDSGSTVKKCFEFAQKVSDNFEIPFLFMTYGNILYKYGIVITSYSIHYTKLYEQRLILTTPWRCARSFSGRSGHCVAPGKTSP